MPPNRNATAGNGGDSQNKAADLAAMIQPTSDISLRFEDRHSAFIAGYERGLQERIDFEIEDEVQARIHQRVRESLGLARIHAAVKGPAWSALIAECGEPDD